MEPKVSYGVAKEENMFARCIAVVILISIYCSVAIAATTKVCTPNSSVSQPCAVPNGIGTQSHTCNSTGTAWGAWGACQTVSCNSGYAKSGNSCIKQPDTTKPTVNFSVTPTSITQGASVTINYTVADVGTGLKQVELWRSTDNKSWTELTGQRKTLSGNGPIQGLFTDTPPAVGTYYYGITPVDNSNNKGESGTKSITVTAKAVPLLAVSLSSDKLAPFGSTTMTVTGGTPPYKISSISPFNSLTVKAAGNNTFTVTAGAIATTATITVQDATSVSKPISKTITIGVPEGWSSVTKYNWPDSNSVKGKIVAAAMGSHGQLSGISIAPGSGWETDIAGNDGTYFKNAINIRSFWMDYDAWKKAHSKSTLAELQLFNKESKHDSTIKESVIGVYNKDSSQDALVKLLIDQFKNSKYVQYDSIFNPKQKDVRRTIADWIISRVPKGTHINEAREVLSVLFIQKQCLEWAMSTAISKGGASVNYKSAGSHGLTKDEVVTPGMGLYHNLVHAMLIIDVKYDKNGKATDIKVAESNNNSPWEWVNPQGNTPWSRTINAGRIEPNWKNYSVVKFD